MKCSVLLLKTLRSEMLCVNVRALRSERRKEMLYLTTHLSHIFDCYMASKIWYKTIQIVREEARYNHIMDYSFLLPARDLLYPPPQTG